MNLYYNEISIIVPTYKRQYNLERIGRFYEDFKLNVYILDSTPNEAKVSLPSNVYYIWTPQLNFAQKIYAKLQELQDVPYIALIADDDFVKEETLLECYGVMKNDSSFSMSNGMQYLFLQAFNNKLYINPVANGFAGKSIIKNDSIGIDYYWKHYQNMLWSLFTREALVEGFRKLSATNYDCGNFPELIVSTEVLRHGNVYISEHPFNFMEINPNDHWGTTTPAICWPAYLKYSSLRNDIKMYKQYFKDDSHALKCLRLHMGNPLKVLSKAIYEKCRAVFRFMKPVTQGNLEEDQVLPTVIDDIMVVRISNAYKAMR